MNRQKKWIWGILAALVVAVVAYVVWKKVRGPEINYREAKVERADLTVSIRATGAAQPENRLEIKPPIAGRVEQVLVREGERVRKGQILAWMSSTERAALLDAARAQGLEEVKRWEDIYRPTPVVAPISGTIILRSVEAGQTFTNTEAILVMSDRLTIKAQVDETDISQIRIKQSASIVLDAYAASSVLGKVVQIAFESKTVNNVTTYVVDILPDETPTFMRAGMTASVTFETASRPQALLAPNEFFRTEEPGRATALVKAAKGPPQERSVKIGLSDGIRTEILEGLQEGEILLVEALVTDAKKPGGISLGPPGRGGRRGR